MATSPTSTGPPSRLGMLASRHRGVVGGLASLGATALAVTFLVVVPEKAGDVRALQSWLIHYAHSTCWALLALAAAGWALRAPRPVVRWAAVGALAAYAAFIAALML